MKLMQSMARRFWLVCLLAFLSGCGGDGSSDSTPVPQGDTQGMILDMVSASTDPDTDGDFLPDDVEAYLGTDPDDPDTDHDGIPDFIEIFGYGTMKESAIVPNNDGDGLIAAVDQDDNNDGVNDGQQVDSDGDGISNYLEYYGYSYSWMSGKYSPWNGTDYTKTYNKSDPHQKSTDQDPFDDNVEATDVNMDVSVKEPGDLPMVPAYPDIVVQIEGYSVTLNQEISWSKGSSMSKGTTWDKSTTSTHSNTSEKNWQAGVSATVSYSPGSLGGSVTGSYNWGGSSSSTAGTSNSVTSGGSILSEENWSRATTQNPTDAAHIKLFLKVYNRGTAVASNVIPTFTLKIGGHNIATFEQGNAQVNLLEPGGGYPAAPGVYWVVDSIDTGTGVVPISLTLGELKALECGAPVSITVTQLSADVMLRNATGVYESAGDWNEYMARIKAVSADLFLDKGDGNIIHGLVYADDRITSPVVTLGDALVWVAKGTEDPITREVFITYYDAEKNVYSQTSLSGWHISVDEGTYRANGFTAADPMPADFNLADLRLNPRSTVVAKGPREQVPNADLISQILAAYYDPTTESFHALVNDYSGIKSVEFVDKNGTPWTMQENIAGSSFYVFTPAQEISGGYEPSGAEVVRVTNVLDKTTEAPFVSVYTPSLPDPPAIDSVLADYGNNRLYVHVTSDISLDALPAFLRIYGAAFTTGLGYGDGYCDMRRVSNSYADPTGWVCDLQPGWTFSTIQDAEIVAYAGPELYTTRKVTVDDVFVHITGTGQMYVVQAEIHRIWPWSDYYTSPQEMKMVDLDAPQWTGLTTRVDAVWLDDSFDPTLVPAKSDLDMWLQLRGEYDPVWVNFGVPSHYVGKEGDPTVPAFDSITSADALGMISGSVDTVNRQDVVDVGDRMIFVYQTDKGRLGKVLVHLFSSYHGDYTTFYNQGYHGRVAVADYKLVTFNPPVP